MNAVVVVSDGRGAAYGEAYRKVDRRADRERQIKLIEDLGSRLIALSTNRLSGPRCR